MSKPHKSVAIMMIAVLLTASLWAMPMQAAASVNVFKGSSNRVQLDKARGILFNQSVDEKEIGTTVDIEAPLVSPADAQTILRGSGVEEFSAPSVGILSSTDATPQIQELARGLKNEPDLIYEYIYNHIEYTPIFGSVKGATGTLLDGKGNDFDQSSLMIALLRQAGYSADFVYGEIRLGPGQITNWLGIDNNPDAIGRLLGSAGIPAQIYTYPDGSLAYVDMNHVWVKVTIDGSDYVFDPSFKNHSYTSSIDLASAMGYNHDDFLSNALSGTTIETDYIQSVNKVNINTDLATYTMNLVEYIKANNPGATLDDIIGGKTINPIATYPRQTSLPYEQSITDEWTEIPPQYQTSLQIQHRGIDETFYSCGIYGKRLTLFYNEANQPVLRLDGAAVATGIATTPGITQDLTLTVDHPYAAYGGTYCDDTRTLEIKTGGSYLVVNGWAETRRGMVEKHRKVLSENLHAGGDDTSEPILGESLAMIGYTWLAECSVADELADQMYKTFTINHHMLGVCGQNEAPYIDMPMCLVSVISGESDSEKEAACFFSGSGHHSAFEWGVIEQLQDYSAVSTVKLIDISNNQSDKIFDATSSNYYTSIKPQLVNYNSYELSYVEDYINAGYRVILPEYGDLGEGDWTGVGFLTISPSENQIGHIISGGLSGGYGTETGTINPQHATQSGDSGSQSENHDQSTEPIDLVTGDYLHEHTDLTIGRRGYPCGLGFKRLYNSGSRLEDGPLGRGWTHNFNINAEEDSDGFQGLGEDSPIDAAAAIVEHYVSIDILKGSKTNERLIIATLAHRCFMDQLIDNIVTVVEPGNTLRFVRLPDGTYNPPPGITDGLVYDTGNNTYTLTRRFGIDLHFNNDGQIETWTDANANTMQIQYDEDGLLTSVADAFGRSLTFNYNADKKLISVRDSAGRTVQFSYDDENLTGFTDPTGETYQHAYDSGHRLTEIYAPSGQRLVTNVYDSFDRVKEQTNGRNYTYQFLWGDYRNMEVDPLGNERIYYFDERARLVAEQDKCGATTQYTYDGQNHRTSITDANGHNTEFTYDGNNNLMSITTALNNTTTFDYDVENHPSSITDPAGNTSSFSYDTHHNLLSITDPLGNTIRYAYNSRGRIISVTDAKGNSITFIYNSNDCLVSSIDALGSTTNFIYDSVGNRISISDPNGSTTSFTYDASHRLTSIIDALGDVTSYTYDVDGNLISRTDGNGDTTQYSYDENFNLIKVTYPTYIVQFGYDELDNLVQVVDPAGTSTYNHDEEGRIISYMDKNGYTVNYSYDPAWNTLSMVYPGHKTMSYNYDAENHLKSLIDWLGGRTNYSYDSRGLLTLTTLPNGAKVEYDYDNADRMISLENTDSVDSIIASYTYTLDPDGNIISETMNQPLLPTPSPISTNYTYGPDNRLITANGVNFQYDNNGNLIQKGNITYQYDYENRLVKVTTPSDTWEYIYDGLGNRIGMTHNGEEHWYLIDPRGITQVLAEYDDGGITVRYIYGLGLISMADTSDNSYYYHYNFIGSTVAMTDATGNVVSKYAYTPFGKLAGMQETVSNPFRYVGKLGVVDNENGLLYMRMRYYDPEVGRFITKDPIGFAGDINLYRYAGDNPVNWVDPYGLHVIGLIADLLSELMEFKQDMDTIGELIEASHGIMGGLDYELEWEREERLKAEKFYLEHADEWPFIRVPDSPTAPIGGPCYYSQNKFDKNNDGWLEGDEYRDYIDHLRLIQKYSVGK